VMCIDEMGALSARSCPLPYASSVPLECTWTDPWPSRGARQKYLLPQWSTATDYPSSAVRHESLAQSFSAFSWELSSERRSLPALSCWLASW
jgi:hypothetical protein